MPTRDPVPFKTSPGRLVWGSVHKARLKKDNNGQPKLIKTGDMQGQPLYMFEFGIAIPKTMAHWSQEPGYGQAIHAEGLSAWPNGQTQRADFAWKIQDGDSAIPNKNQKRPCDQAGYKGCWVLSFSGMSAPRIAVAITGAPQWTDQNDLINPGDWVEVMGAVVGNESTQTAGVYLNHSAVCMRGYGERISVMADVDVSGFGGAPLPAGASLAPIGQAMAPIAPPAPITPYVGTVPVQPAAVIPVPVVPNPAFIPAAPPARQMTAKANGASYDAMKANGWTDALLVEHGMMLA